MRNTGVIFREPAITGAQGRRLTNDVCRKVDQCHYVIDGRRIEFPVAVDDASMLLNAFLVDSKKAQAVIADSGFRVMEIYPGRAMLQLLAVDYRKNELGDYNEAAIIFPVLTPGERKPLPFFGPLRKLAGGSAGSFVYRMPVDQEFTTHAGRFIWGFPKWVSRIDIAFGQGTATGAFIDDDELVFAISAKTGGKIAPKAMRAASLAIRDGKAWKTYGTSSGSGMTFSLGGNPPEIGTSHPLALELRALGLPRKPLFSIAQQHTVMSFEAPESVAIGAAFRPS